MARQIERLSSPQVKHAKPGMHPDGGGLCLQVTTGKDGQINKSWIFRFAVAGKERQMGLGSEKTIGLRDARDEAERCRKLLQKGKDPIVERDAKEAEQQVANAKSMTFDRCAELFMKSQQWRNTLMTYASPIIGKLLVRDVDTALVMSSSRSGPPSRRRRAGSVAASNRSWIGQGSAAIAMVRTRRGGGGTSTICCQRDRRCGRCDTTLLCRTPRSAPSWPSCGSRKASRRGASNSRS